MLDFFKIPQHRIIFSILAALIGILLVIGIIFGFLILAHGVRNGLDGTNTITFSGEGKISTKPDTAFVDFSVVTQGTKISDVQSANTEKMNKVTEFLKGYGIEDKDIKTTNYNLYPQYNYENYRVPQIIGYQITQTLSIKIKNLEKVGEIMEKVVALGINQVNSLYFGVEDDEQLKEQARDLAIADAKEKAETLALQLGIRLGRLKGFSETVSGYPVPIYDAAKAYGMGGGNAPEIQTGESEIVIDVMLTYEMR
jgi:uncharacterized protein YggE